MKERLNIGQNILIGSLLFGLYFGAGNLIFPVKMGQMAGQNMWLAAVGFLITGVGLPVLGIIGSALAKSKSMLEMTGPTGKLYSVIFTCLLYLTIGPLFAIPRTATVAFEVGLRPFVSDEGAKTGLIVFSVIFFAITLFFALRPARIIDWVGKYLTPLFLILLSVLIVLSIVNPMSNFAQYTPQDAYMSKPLITGLLDGYNTMDALASLAFAIIIITNINKLGVHSPGTVAKETFKSGIVSTLGMSVIYVALTYIGATSLGIIGEDANGGAILSAVGKHYLGRSGQVLLAGIVTVACIKTAIGLITACSEMFVSMFPKSLPYKGYAILFTTVSLIIANFGLGNIISFSIPMLMFLYPMSIVTILLSLMAGLIHKSGIIYKWTMGFTTAAALFDLFKALPEPLVSASWVQSAIAMASRILPGYDLGFGWLVPTLIGFVIGIVACQFSKAGKILSA